MNTVKSTGLTLSGETFTRHIILPMASIVVIAIAVVLGFVLASASGQNKLEVEASTKLATTALQVKAREVSRNLRDYAVWEDVYKNLHEKVDTEWAATDGNVGANIYEGLGYEMAFAIDPGGNTVYAVIEGVPTKVDAFQVMPRGLRDLLHVASIQTDPVTSLIKSGQDVFIVAATSILPPSIERSTVRSKDLSMLVFAKKLNQKFLDGIARDYLLSGLAIMPENPTSAEASIPLLAQDRIYLGSITWTPAKPGYQLLRFILPPLAVAIIFLAAFSVLVVRGARRSTRALEESARTVEAYAQTLKESEARFKDVAEASSDWIWESDPNLRLVYFSARFTEMTGIAAANVLGKTLEQFFSSDTDSDGWRRLIEETHERASFRDIKCYYRDAAGQTRICRLAGRPIMGTQGDFLGFRGTATDITEEVEAQQRATHLALHDALTGLPNRLLFRERLNVALAGNASETSRVAVICLDLDHFKEINDTLGHGAGDVLLQQLSSRLLGCVRTSDTVARLGGDEFAIIQVGVHQPFEAEQLSRKLIDVVKAPFHIDGQDLHIGVSVGIAIADALDSDPERLLKNADIALYRAKQAGRATFKIFEAQMDLELQARKALEYDLRQAVLKDELEVHYQPLIDIETRAVAAVEALVRWRHPTRGLVSPGEFITLAEETGLITGIGEWVLETACRQALQWPQLRVAVNLSPVQFRSRELIDTVKGVLSRTGLDPSRLELEITESVLINDATAAIEILNALKNIGVKIAMDDFGTGYSSLGYLNSFPFDKIKIDKSFIGDMSSKEKSGAIVKSVISLGQSLNMVTTAEGVETIEQATFLTKEGCDQLQGFYFSKPVTATELTSFIDHWDADAAPNGTTTQKKKTQAGRK
ncbi:EAL domain-containing protein [Rhizobium sp. BK251]|uniref:bifunctional diguanylate cyclase/phosphodiesterase n=1 Tax=Rhizobium sp. BK251 TaxID=2512125 RepID=UPI0010534F4E|nr:EAL domain-containing protein [Rhizobium sp. BK251]TCL69481.1 PAS domain S-box-containing protein/diguanylate cyclase (GGDEF)-like protein [Rhizobium sp. BK251]